MPFLIFQEILLHSFCYRLLTNVKFIFGDELHWDYFFSSGLHTKIYKLLSIRKGIKKWMTCGADLHAITGQKDDSFDKRLDYLTKRF